MKIAALITNPAVIKMSATLWKPMAVEYDTPDHPPPRITKSGAIDGITDPPPQPETIEEAIVGLRANLLRNISFANQNQEQPNAFCKVDQNGRILGETSPEIVPETDNERDFLTKWDQANG